jgi:hypothetical protein
VKINDFFKAAIQQHSVNRISETDVKANSLKEALDRELKCRRAKKLQYASLQHC